MALVENALVENTASVEQDTVGLHPAANGLSAEQVASFREQGYLVVRGVFDDATLDRFETAARSHPPVDQVVPGQPWPGPGRWTLARNAMSDPDLAFLPASPEMVEPMRSVLGDDPKILMFAYYDRTPGGPGLPSHNDYKRWRPIGSSMRWAFAIVPLVDFDDECGKLEFAPGSHRVAHTPDPWSPVHNAARAVRPSEDDFIDPELRRGDLAIVDMHMWHRAGANNSSHHRNGLFTKWCAASHPPATGYFPHIDAEAEALGPEGAHILGVHSARPITTARAVIERVRGESSQYLFCDDGGVLSLPGAEAVGERSIPDWDDGNYIASLTDALEARIQTRPPWMSWIGDYDEGTTRTRVYGYRVPEHAWGVHAKDIVWLSADEAAARSGELAFGYEADAVARWLDPTLVRGKGVTQALGRADQYAC